MSDMADSAAFPKGGGDYGYQKGMSIRTYLVGQILAGQIAKEGWTAEQIALRAVKVADAALAAMREEGG